MSEVRFFQTRMGQQYYEVTLPNLVREVHRLNDLLALAVEMLEKLSEDEPDDRSRQDPQCYDVLKACLHLQGVHEVG